MKRQITQIRYIFEEVNKNILKDKCSKHNMCQGKFIIYINTNTIKAHKNENNKHHKMIFKEIEYEKWYLTKS